MRGVPVVRAGAFVFSVGGSPEGGVLCSGNGRMVVGKGVVRVIRS
ncbi:hypothetical protein B005_4458 [Nocardiopsis alba ATCC BAA-2165]|uniref:Uncharacterized protein n=1 Tax=Nocardiopsis alba (strain ATCC BAA-2165 / BE74) TaxID=1205910 RepID=J7L5C9_NOCAA|nr:hypothetical protein B005_4458 [Nocardiopsis alba ATCC BAA-2165]